MKSFFTDSKVSYTDTEPLIGKYDETYKQESQGFAFAISYSIFR